MTKKSNTILLFTDQREAINYLPNEQAGLLLKAIYAYADDGTIPKFDGAIMSVFTMIRTQIDRSQDAYAKKCERNRANARKRYVQMSAIASDRMPSDTNASESLPSEANASLPNPNQNPNPEPNPNPSIEEGVVSPSINVTEVSVEEYYSFDRIWELYDKPVGDVPLLQQKWDALSLDEKKKIFEYVPKYVQVRERRYRKDFINFLNCRTWETEPINTETNGNRINHSNYTSNGGKRDAAYKEASELVLQCIAECEGTPATSSEETEG